MDVYYEKNHIIRSGEWLVQNNKIDEKLKKKLKDLQKYFHGGGSPTLAFLDANSTKNTGNTVSKLRECATEKKRKDVVDVLEGISDDNLLRELGDNVKTEIADLLDRHVAGADNWEVFSCYFGFKYTERKVS